MMSKETGGPAFPQPYGHVDQAYKLYSAGELTTEELELVATRLSGMTLRDHFAGLAMQGAISGHISYYGHETNHWRVKDIASYAYELADAMIEAMNQ